MSRDFVGGLFAAVFAAVLGVILTPFWNEFAADMKQTIGAPLVAVIGMAILLGVFAFGLAVLHYFGVLGAGSNPTGTRERKDYDALRQRIVLGNWVAREYSHKLTIFLDALDNFLGDEGMASRSLFPHAFGLSKPAPLWTAASLDRCLLLALIYPVAAITLIWALSNEVGPAEGALGLKTTDGLRRALIITAIGTCIFAYWRGTRTKGLRSMVWRGSVIGLAVVAAYAVAAAGPGLFTGIHAGAGIGPAIAIAVAGGGAGADAVAIAAACAFAFSIAVAGPAPFIYAIIIPNAFLAASFVQTTHQTAVRRERLGVFLAAFVLFMFVLCFAAAIALSSSYTWKDFGPLLLFLGLLTLLNGPFDWASLGLTRALMRRGLERERWWPYGYAAIDAVLTVLVTATLALTIVVSVQLFDDLAVYGGGERVLPPMREFLDAIRSNPGRPEYWWVYATLFSTTLPSLINLFLAGVSLARGVPGISSWLLDKIREGEAVPTYDRLLVAIVLSLQGLAGLAIALVAQGFFFWIIVWRGMPLLGVAILDLASFVAH